MDQVTVAGVEVEEEDVRVGLIEAEGETGIRSFIVALAKGVRYPII